MKPLIVIVGPTAVGKTALSIELANHIDGEIINGDAFQVYKHLNVGTAKVTIEEQKGIPHHLLDWLDPRDTFSVAQFQQAAKHSIASIQGRGRIPILVGGTGMYVKSVTSNWTFDDRPADAKWRQQMEARAREPGGKAKLHAELAKKDQEAASRIHENNVRKVIRALELLERGDEAPAPVVKNNPTLDDEVVMIGLEMERARLYERIEQRVDLMLSNGLLEEVESLYNEGIRDTQAMKAIGYKELVQYLEGKVSFEKAVDDIKKHSRQFAKRQLTWFKNKEIVTWFDMGEKPDHKDFQGIIHFLEGKLSDVSKST